MHQQHVRHRHRPFPLSNVFFFVTVVVLLFQEHYHLHPYRRSIVVAAQKMTILLFFVKISYCYHPSLCGELLITSLVQIMIPRQQINMCTVYTVTRWFRSPSFGRHCCCRSRHHCRHWKLLTRWPTPDVGEASRWNVGTSSHCCSSSTSVV